MFLVFFGNANSFICYSYFIFSTVTLCCNCNARIFFGKFCCIAYEVDQNIPQQFFISIYFFISFIIKIEFLPWLQYYFHIGQCLIDHFLKVKFMWVGAYASFVKLS